jgi:hypothetical protein
MHWTSLLEKRRIPATARVRADLPCGGCGYNLRQALAVGRCPECGRPVLESLVPFDDPFQTASTVSGIAGSFLMLFPIYLVTIITAAVWFTGRIGLMLVIAAALHTIAAVVRMFGVLTLLRRNDFRGVRAPVPTLHLLRSVCIIDVIIALIMLITFYVYQRSTLQGAGFLTDWRPLIGAAGLAVTHVVLRLWTRAVGKAGQQLDYDLIEREARIQGLLYVLAGLVATAAFVVFALIGNSQAMATAFTVLAIITVVVIGISTLVSVVASLHLSNAIRRELDMDDRLVDAERTSYMDEKRAHEKPPPPLPDIAFDDHPSP